MVREPVPFDVSEMPELARLAHEVAASGDARVLREHGTDLAVLAPARPAKRGQQGDGDAHQRTTRRRVRGKVFTAADPLWNIVGLLTDDGGPTDVARNIDRYLAEAYIDTHA
jgi:hypothetical protein